MPSSFILPEKYRGVGDMELAKRVDSLKKEYGSDLCILGHYYERDEIVVLSDHVGDSFQLAKAGAATNAKFIVFCGVHFMAEASVILAKEGQRVFLPDMAAGCPLADFATIEQVEAAWTTFERAGVAAEIIPITYMNSSAAIKAFCGRNGGLVCTSSSAGKAFDFAFAKGKRIFFLPDENLGMNTAAAKGIGPNGVSVYDPYSKDGGLGADEMKRAKVIGWKGYCHVHTLFTTGHVAEARKKYPGCKVVVHPECDPEVVEASDANGSTAFLKKFAEDAPSGSTIVIGTEINLVARLAKAMKDKKVVPLARSLCPNMFKISLADLLWTLEELPKVNEVLVPYDITRDAKKALDLMLTL